MGIRVLDRAIAPLLFGIVESYRQLAQESFGHILYADLLPFAAGHPGNDAHA